MARLVHESATVWIVEDNQDYREATQELIDSRDGLRCTYTFGSCEDVLVALNVTFAPDVVLMDIGLPGRSGIECVERFKRIAPSTEIIMLTIHADDDSIFNALCAGATGYLLKAARPEKIIEAVEASVRGGVLIDTRIARRVLRMFTQFTAPRWDYDLTPREREVLEGIVDGKTKQQIADDLFLAFSTVDSHLRNVYTKLQVHSRTAAVTKALRERLL